MVLGEGRHVFQVITRATNGILLETLDGHETRCEGIYRAR